MGYPVPRVHSELSSAGVSVSRVEPALWWVGMRSPSLLLTLCGPGVGFCRPSVTHQGVSIERTYLTDSVNYLFVELHIEPEAATGALVIHLLQAAVQGEGKKEQGAGDKEPGTDNQGPGAVREVSQATLQLLPRRRGADNRPALTPADVVYLALPDRFATDRRHPCDRQRHGGTLAGIRRHLDHVKRLGMTALWLTPVLADDLPTDSFHGYATSDFYHIDPRLGSNDDYRMLVAALHQRGLKAIFDLVPGHCATSHPWLDDCPDSHWFNHWNGDPWACNHRPSVTSDCHASHIDRLRTTQGWFAPTMADLNLRNPLVARYMAQVAIFWTEWADLDALRLDTVPYNEPEGLQLFLAHIYKEYPSLTLLAETWLDEAAKLAPWQDPTSGATASLTPMDFPLQEALTAAFNEDFGWHRGANRLYDALSNDHLFRHPERMLIFGDNHDTGRLFTRLAADQQSLKLALIFLATTRGMPQLYYGTEWLFDGEALKGDETIRQDLPEEWFDHAPEARADFASWVANLFAMRKANPTLHEGGLTHFVPDDNLYVYVRHDANARILVALNLRRKRTLLDATRYAEFTGGSFDGLELLTNHRVQPAQRIAMKPRTAVVIKLQHRE